MFAAKRPPVPAAACAVLILAIAIPAQSGRAQFGGVGGAAGGLGNQLGGNQFGGVNQVGGILIDAAGIVRAVDVAPQSARLKHAAREAFLASHADDEFAALTDRRYVSLIRLEREVQRRLESRQPPGDDVTYLGGIVRIDYLFVDREGHDLILAGPAEGFLPDETGRMVGVTTGRPPLRLDDFLVALRAAAAGTGAIGCSIDPEPARLAQLQEFVARNSNTTSPAGAARRYQEMARILGQQNVAVFGVPADSHFAVTLVEADFRMKRISLGVEPSGVSGLPSYLSLLRPQGNSIQRWWFTPYYEALWTNDDQTVFQFAGQRVQLLAQEEIASAAGVRSDAAFTRASTETFARRFTDKYPDLAARAPLFAELQNLFDMAVVAALLYEKSLPQQIGWEMTAFSRTDPELIPVYAVPRHVPSESTFRRAGRGLILGLVGGVTIEPRQVLQRIDDSSEAAARLDGLRRLALDTRPADEQVWWWE